MGGYIPAHVRRFRDALAAVRMPRISLEVCKPAVEGIRGILTTTRLQYSEEPWQILRREHEYLFWLPSRAPLEISVQLYENTASHWRLFAYCAQGMLLSLNLTTMQRRRGVVTLSQTLRLATRSMTSAERLAGAERLCRILRGLGYEMDEKRRLVLGTFDGRRGEFLDTRAEAFVRDFVVAAALKGHFMANKGYRLPGLRVPSRGRTASSAKSANRRSIPLGLRFEVLDRDQARCKACGSGPADGVRLHVDHIVPWSHGGRTELGNLQTFCEACNLGKGNRSSRRY